MMIEQEKVYEFEHNGIKYYYNKYREADGIIVEKDKEGKDRFIGKFNCLKCNGKGQSSWRRDNGICYDCRGLGYWTNILNVTKNKETAERRIIAKAEKKQKQLDENYKLCIERNLEYNLKKYGEVFYIILDTLEHSTYTEREYLKSKEARWNPSWNCWWSKKTDTIKEDFKDFKLCKISFDKVKNESNCINDSTIRDIVIENKVSLDNKRGVLIK